MLFFPAPAKAPERVVVTSLGIVTAYGVGWQANAAGFQSGKPTFKEVTLFDVSRQRVKMAAQVDLPVDVPSGRLHPRKAARMERAAKLLFLAAAEALQDGRFSVSAPCPLVLGTTSGGMSMGEAYFQSAMGSSTRRSQPTRVTYYLAQRQGMDLCEAWGISGPITIIANACAAGANAVGHAFELVRSGRYERALAGGYDALSHLVFAGFDSLQALSPTRCRPFDTHRDGLALGEGAAVLGLESLASARRRGAEVLAEVVGYGAATDGHHLTQPHPEGDAALQTMSLATAMAGLEPSRIGYLNAHGTGTPLNDSSEAEAIRRWAGESAESVWVSSTKAGIGHLLGAAGAVESAACILALREQWLPPSLSTQTLDPKVRFRLITKPTLAKELSQPFEYAMTNSFGFGGANASLVFRRDQ